MLVQTHFKRPLWLLLSFLFAFPSLLSAQDEAQAKMILYDALQRYKNYRNIKIDFTVLEDNPSRNLHRTRKGTAYIQGSQHVLQINSREITSDGRTIWTYAEKTQKIYISDYDPNDGKITPDEVFREDFLKKDLYYRYIKNPSDDRSTAPEPSRRSEEVIELIPKGPDKNYLKFRVYVDTHTKLLNHWKVYMKNGSTIDYQINMQPNVALNPSFFRYSRGKYPSQAQVVDLRRK